MEKIGAFLKTVNREAFDAPQQKSITEYRISKIQIKNGYRYEQGLAQPRSEFSINAVITYSNGPANFIYLPIGRNGDHAQMLKKIKKSEVNSSSIININEFFSPNYNSNPYALKVYWNTFERDWNRTNIDLGHSTNSDPKTWILPGKARYSGDWYQWIPSTTSDHRMNYGWLWKDPVKFESWKSSITFYPN